ncbi:ABC transporter permease [Dyadobacter aurulentus]|uniref:ABC transporter permease n=1 Tax=Dyadobacter sp. UC 10 TaxID=2605428 RepID=UPI001CEC5E10|nr:ABC transporter permease [Dyadobacter sp. UC 10]
MKTTLPEKKAQPPQWAQRFLEWYCRPGLLEDLQGDLNEYFDRNVKTKGARRARWIYVMDVFKFFRPYTVRKPDFLNLYIHYFMISSYLKTSRRSLVRNKLFSFINIVGLAISMSVGLLVIALLTDFLSYDDFHKKKQRIYRVVTKSEQPGQSPADFASMSLKAGKQMKESFTGFEDLTQLRPGFSRDARIGKETILPLTGWWADESFFKVFTFPMKEGDPATALREPYSLVLTEKTAKKLFGDSDALGKSIQFDTLSYTVTGILEDIPNLSHLRFEALVSFASAESEGWFSYEETDWEHFYSNYTYFTIPENGTTAAMQANLNQLAARENKGLKNGRISLSVQPLSEITLGKHYSNEIGHSFPMAVALVLGGLAFVVVLSACFNYTNLSIARSLRRSREVGVRKIVGALKGHVLGQFVAESVIIALLALVFSFLLFLVLRKQFMSLEQFPDHLVALELTPKIVLYFIAFATLVGIAAGFLPALFFSRMKAIQVLKGTSGITVFRRVNLRKTLILIQYTFSLMFITTTMLGYHQYKEFLAFDLGFKTDNIVNIWMQDNKAELLKKELAEMPEVGTISRSNIVTSIGTLTGTNAKYKDPADSVRLYLNFVDNNYLPLHQHKFLAGRNFTTRPAKGNETEIIVNEQVLKRFNVGNRDPKKALGEVLQMDDKKLTIVGVLKDFHFGTAENKIEPMAFRQYDSEQKGGYLNVSVKTKDWAATRAGMERAWKKVDKVHELKARFYDEQIEIFYSQYSVVVKVIGFITFLTVCIASMGLLGMVVFTTETRLREISVRKVLGASEGGLVFLLSRGFLSLLLIAALLSLPATYLFFDKVVLANFVYHAPIDVLAMLTGVLVVMLVAFLIIGSQALRAARSNPAAVLKSE